MRYVDLNALPDTRTPRTSLLTNHQVRYATAIHETAHALVGTAYGMSLARIRLTESPLPDGGVSTGGLTTWNRCRVDEFEFAVQCAAGAVAEQRAYDEAGLTETTSGDHDREAALAVLAQSSYDVVQDNDAVPPGAASWRQITETAHQEVNALWPQIVRIANALVAAPDAQLDADRIRTLTTR